MKLSANHACTTQHSSFKTAAKPAEKDYKLSPITVCECGPYLEGEGQGAAWGVPGLGAGEQSGSGQEGALKQPTTS